MSSLTRALLIRFFGTKRLGVESVSLLIGLLVLVLTLPYVITLIGYLLFWLFAVLSYFVILGLIAFILPGILIALIGVAIGGGLLVLVGRGYLNLAVRYYNWLRLKYSLAQEDEAFNALFANNSSEFFDS